jgi:hypothetical protein
LLPLLLSCGGGDGGATGPKAVPGELTLSLVTPNSDDRAVLISIAGPGPISAITASRTESMAFSQVTTGKASVAVFGALTSGPLVRFTVPDVAAAASYSATVTEVVDPANNPRSGVAGYAATIAK